MSMQQLKELFGNQEAILELVQLEGGELALRNAGSEQEPLVKIQFSDEVKAILGEQTPMVAQHMIQAALFGLLEKQMNELQAEIVDEQPTHFSLGLTHKSKKLMHYSPENSITISGFLSCSRI